MHSLRQRCCIKKTASSPTKSSKISSAHSALLKKKIVPITIGINNNDIKMIGESIMESEQKKFDELVAKHLKNPSCVFHKVFCYYR